jgi:hypothetical protein
MQIFQKIRKIEFGHIYHTVLLKDYGISYLMPIKTEEKEDKDKDRKTTDEILYSKDHCVKLSLKQVKGSITLSLSPAKTKNLTTNLLLNTKNTEKLNLLK